VTENINFWAHCTIPYGSRDTLLSSKCKWLFLDKDILCVCLHIYKEREIGSKREGL
jgi:hypothetical protein